MAKQTVICNVTEAGYKQGQAYVVVSEDYDTYICNVAASGEPAFLVHMRKDWFTKVPAFSEQFTYVDLLAMHDRYMEVCDEYTGTRYEGIVNSSYSELVGMLGCSEMGATAAFLIVYKQNVRDIDAANDYRRNL